MENNFSSQKFFLYARKSTDVEDKQVLSIEAQIAELRAFAKQNNLNIIEELIEKQSAKIPGRPMFNEMLNRIEKGEGTGILAWHPDRLARNSIDGGKIIYLLDCGRITALKFPQFWFEPTPQGKFMLSIAFGQSKYYVDSLSENTKRGLRQKVRRGEYPGLAPIGYLNDVRTKTIEVNRKRSKIIKAAFELYSKGNSTLGDISHFLAQQGILTRGSKSYKRDKISFILSNPFYYGYFRYSGELHDGKHEPIIAKKLFDKVQEVLKLRSKPQRKERIPKAFTGLFHCGECGMMITAEIQKDHVYYRCTKKSKTKICNQPYTREEDLNEQLSSMIQKVSLRQDWARQVLKMLDKEKEDNAQSCFAFAQQNQDKIKELKQKLQFLLDSYLDQVIEREIYLEKKSGIMSQIKTLEEQNIRFEQKQNDWLEPFREWINEAANAAKIARDNDLFAKKVLASKIYGSNLVLENKKARGEAQNQWAALCAAPRSLTVVRLFDEIRTFFERN
jgi:DNA invertase Pin-like site-specific DNA recombinase